MESQRKNHDYNIRHLTMHPVSRWSGCQKYLAETPPGVYQNRPTGTDDGRAERSDNLSEEKKKEIKEVVDILKKMNKEELAATKFFGLGVVSSSEGRTDPTAHK